MGDPCFSQAVELIEETRTMPPSEAGRYLLDRYRCASPEFREAIVCALAGAVATARLLAGVRS